MALFQVDYYSRSLEKSTCFHMVLPNDVHPMMKEGNENYNRKMKTLFLLHGYSGSSKDWLLGSPIQELALKYNMAVIMPSGDNSFYLDAKGTGRAYCKFVGQELVDYIRNTFNIAMDKEDTFIGGLSMGGFGAIHTGLFYPETFGKIVALSSALIIRKIMNITEDFTDAIADYDYYTSVFGNLDELENSVNNPEYLVKKLKEENKKIPDIYMACGTEDFLIEDNREFYKFLKDEEVDVKYIESPGAHTWDFWSSNLEPSIQWLLS
ncbi:alpha/beta hydrolase [Herbinix luporum]|uniref:alpha/beta hydrolase n=1 Tax=Herbinix luporum TaxID=1679721 RepID=UPI0023F29B01|nr:alpha/beta hydrolase family protein [Herbinix luporum]